ncbi:n-acetylmuramoyl-L-alanine amidase [Azospirillum sp. CAG:260]|jgi:N-acetylmuramoyl-L-alanine amidase|nr:n-acetylmuramoyl-L-alanine amidase [Azospirillum sp. CAG:260]
MRTFLQQIAVGMKGLVRQVLATAVIFCCAFSAADSVAASGITSMRIGQGVGSVRIVFDADRKFDYKVFLLNEPKRLVIDTFDVKVSPEIEKYVDKNNLVTKTRLGSVGTDGIRIVFDLQKPAIVKKAFMLAPQSNFGWRFVIDVSIASEREFSSKVGSKYALSNENSFAGSYSSSSSKSSSKAKTVNKKKIIVLDPGHGGKDPGAIGYSGVYEKNITLAMAKELKVILEKEGYKVHLTRSTDIFIPLRDRVKIARKYNADLFMSIHADSAVNRSAKGLSVYTLSETASDKEAAALAERENKADVVAGLNLLEHSKEVSDILINLAQRETMNRSSEFASFMVQEMRKSVKLRDNTHRFAGFAVLKAPDVPSVLLEMGYLSNRTEERLLKQKDYRRKLAVSTSKAVEKYFDNMQHASVF